MMRRVFLVLGLTLVSGSAAWAIPQTLNFQGLLKESGLPVNGTRQMSFKIWDSASGGTSLFTEPASGTTSVTVSTGIFNVVIGSIISGGIPLSVFDGSDRYVEVVVGAATLPRQKITSVGNAFFAATAANLAPSTAIQISSAVFTATGAVQYSIQTSSGINVQAGGVTAPFFSGSFVGDGSGLSGLTGTDSTKVAKAGDTMTGQLTLVGSTLTITGNAFSVGGSTLAAVGGKIGIGTASPSTKLHLNSGALTIDGSGAGSSVTGPSTATYFYGDGSGLTGVTGTDGTKVAKAGDTMTGQLTLSGSTLTVTGNAFSVGGATLSVAVGRIGLGTASPATKLHLSSGIFTIDGTGAGMSVGGPSTATYFYGNGSGLTGVTDGTKIAKTGDAMTGQLTLSGSTLTVTGNAFSVGGTTLTVTGGKIGVGTENPAANLDVNGSAQFGSGATKSTFTSTGLLKLTPSGIQWADGSTSTTATAAASSGGGINASTATISRTFVSTTDGHTFAGCNSLISTLTFTTDNVPVDIRLYAQTYNDVANEGCYVFVLTDGAFFDGFTATQPMAYIRNGGVSNNILQVAINHRTRTSLSAGSHSFCVGITDGGGGTCYLRCDLSYCNFEIREAR